jgi:hypothetical protein
MLLPQRSRVEAESLKRRAGSSIAPELINHNLSYRMG